MPARDYPDKRTPRGFAKNADLKMLSARIASSLVEFVSTTAYETRRSKQEIIAEALELYRKSRECPTEPNSLNG